MDNLSPVEILKRMREAVSVSCECIIGLDGDENLVLRWRTVGVRGPYEFNMVVTPRETCEIDRLIDQAGCSLNRRDGR